MVLKFISALLALLMPAFALAQGVTPVIFERQDIHIEPAVAPAKEGETPIVRDMLDLNIEVRSEEALQLEYIHSLNSLEDDGGVMIVFAAPSLVTLPSMQVYTPTDVLFLAEDGTIMQIFPGIVLGSQTQDIMSPEPIKAFLFLKAGEVAAKGIRPHDIILGKMFTPAPAMMQ